MAATTTPEGRGTARKNPLRVATEIQPCTLDEADAACVAAARGPGRQPDGLCARAAAADDQRVPGLAALAHRPGRAPLPSREPSSNARGESLQHEGCEIIPIVRDQDDPDHVAGFTQWTERRNFEDYLAWRTEHGFTATFEAMLTRPFVIHFYDIAYYGEGIAAGQTPER
jgi:hypothetical protein